MTTTLPPADGWEPVPAGSLERCAWNWRCREWRRRTVSVASTLLLLLAFGGAFWWLLPPGSPLTAETITCSKCHDLAESYVQEKLDRQDTLNVKTHLSHCDHCLQYVNTLLVAPPRAQRGARPGGGSPLVASVDALTAASR